MTDGSLPGIHESIDLYLAACRYYEDTPFSSADLAERILPEGATTDLDHRLDLATAYGLLDRVDDDRYRIRCGPDEPFDQWRERAAARGEAVHELVARTAERRPPNGEAEIDTQLGSRKTHKTVLRHDGEPYISVFPLDYDDTKAVSIAVSNELDSSDAIVGVVLRSSGEMTNRVQQVADHLCELGQTSEFGPQYAFEKVQTDLVGTHKDNLEFRLYLRRM